MTLSSALIDLAALKQELLGAYDDYDRAVAVGSKADCLNARKRIMDDIRPAVAAAVSAPQGIYLFADLARTHMDSLIYIGCAHKSDLIKRLGDYLIRDISGLDMELAKLAESDARAKIDARIAVTMPATAQQTRAKYVVGHLRTMRLTNGGTVLVTSMDEAELVTAVEGMLFARRGAWARAWKTKSVVGPPPAYAVGRGNAQRRYSLLGQSWACHKAR